MKKTRLVLLGARSELRGSPAERHREPRAPHQDWLVGWSVGRSSMMPNRAGEDVEAWQMGGWMATKKAYLESGQSEIVCEKLVV